MESKNQQAKEAAVKVQWVPIDTVMPNPTNPRKISEASVKALMESLTELELLFNLRFLVADRENGFLLGGNQRWTAAKRLGMKEVPVAYADEMTEAQKQEFIIRDNIELGEWDNEKLDIEFADFPLVEWGMQASTKPEPAEKRAVDVNDLAEAKQRFDNAEIKQITVYYDAETQAETMAKIDKIKEANYLTGNAEVLTFLLDNYGE